MTTQHAGTITFYDPDTGQITRTVTGNDVTELEAHAELLNAEITRLQAQYDETEQMRAANYARAERLEHLVCIAQAIMRTPPIGVPPRLLDEWREVSEKVEEER